MLGDYMKRMTNVRNDLDNYVGGGRVIEVPVDNVSRNEVVHVLKG